MKLCTVPGCDRPLLARGMCGPCYRKQWKEGNLDSFPKRTPTPRKLKSLPIEPIRDDLRAFTERHGTKETAERIGLTEGHLHHLLNRNRFVDLDVADRVCIALGLPFHTLFPLEVAS